MYRIHNQSTTHKDSDWTSSRAKEFYLKLRASGRMHLKKCVWRSASEETSLKKSSWRHVIRSNGHQKHLARSYFTRVDKVQRTKCTTTNSATTISATLSLHQDFYWSSGRTCRLFSLSSWSHECLDCGWLGLTWWWWWWRLGFVVVFLGGNGWCGYGVGVFVGFRGWMV